MQGVSDEERAELLEEAELIMRFRIGFHQRQYAKTYRVRVGRIIAVKTFDKEGRGPLYDLSYEWVIRAKESSNFDVEVEPIKDAEDEVPLKEVAHLPPHLASFLTMHERLLRSVEEHKQHIGRQAEAEMEESLGFSFRRDE